MKKARYLSVCLISFLIFGSFTPAIGIAGCYTAFAASERAVEPEAVPNGQKVNDPYEKFNREVFDFNDHVYMYVLKPVSRGYSAVFPAEVRQAIRSGYHNLVFPSRFINLVLQGKMTRAGNEMLRFIINSALGIAGLLDIAQARFGLENHEADFGQTLGIWGIGPGPFLMIPILGPSDPRDLLGFGADEVMDPMFWIPADWWVTSTAQAGKFINNTSLSIGEYEELKRASLDPYVAMRDAYIQYRAHLISE